MVIIMLVSVLFTGFITSQGFFPKPLTDEEEKKYTMLYANGDESARNILIERNLRLVVHVAKKYSNISYDIDDLISIGTIGLIKAITTYDINRGWRIATYAAKCIENEILMQLRCDKKNQNELYLQEPIGQDFEGNDLTLLDILEYNGDSVEEEIEKKNQRSTLYKKMSQVLRAREYKILKLRYGLFNSVEKTQREIAKKFGISRSYVSVPAYDKRTRAIEKITGQYGISKI
jgi:RNA polymerase sporulation-specific sigma factor